MTTCFTYKEVTYTINVSGIQNERMLVEYTSPNVVSSIGNDVSLSYLFVY